ncbi:hepatoma-derived growth factor-related protein 2-like isoform X2 [Sitodiplosis mosellana]|uniref:hepatoma-derived growth factor-related protein 2-like isoform X2 n=1 Tax=Sitodiplosis mosellana TaxID=263140 RepID=UPI0024452C62|nr:hepatoma-derived growth factor-related protein 2-like isoform X2 [Sitodiplosis mosellana]
MGKKDSFNVGDLVFAKVKGYPAWPAKIVDITKSKKYSVYFYGTGETGNVQAKDVSLYEKTKQKLATSSSMKKQDFKAAIDQIEDALRGNDPAPNSYEIPLDKSNATFDNTLNSTLDTTGFGGNSTKIDESQIEDDNDEGEAEEAEAEPEPDPVEQEPEPEPEQEPESDDKDEGVDTANDNEVASEAVEEVAVPVKPETVKPEPVAKPEPELNVTPVVAKETPKAEPKSEAKSSRSGRVIKKTKYLHDEFEESPQVPVKRKRPSESQTPIAKIQRKADEISTSAESHGEIKVSQIIMNEVNLLQYDVDIKSSLQLSSADTSRCISVLEKYKNLEVTALMLKKNPQVAETIKRLRRYVGNTKEWNFTDEQRIEFNDKATKIRKLAEIIYKNFKKLFSFPPHLSFWQGFTDEVQSFKEQTKSLTHEELITLTEDVQPAVNQSIEVKNSIRV